MKQRKSPMSKPGGLLEGIGQHDRSHAKQSNYIIAWDPGKGKGIFMKFDLICKESGIASCCSEEMPYSIRGLGQLNECVLFYDRETDFIVSNRDNVNYDFYVETLPKYMSLPTDIRHEVIEKIKETAVYGTMEVVEQIISIRENREALTV